MDTSERLDFFLGRLWVPADEITAEEWFGIIDYALKWCRHALPNINLFREFGQTLENRAGETKRITMSKDVVSFLPLKGNKLDMRTRCMFLALIDPPEPPAPSVFEERQLLLTMNNTLVYARFAFEEGDEEKRVSTAHVEELDSAEFRSALRRQPKLGWAAMQVLRNALQGSIEASRRRQIDMQGALDRINKVHEHVGEWGARRKL